MFVGVIVSGWFYRGLVSWVYFLYYSGFLYLRIGNAIRYGRDSVIKDRVADRVKF